MSDELSRRRFLSLRAHHATVEERACRRVAKIRAPIRPPGALEEIDFLQTCEGGEGCDACVQACPYGSIFVLRTEDIADGTPVLSPSERPCHLCEDRACVAACPTEALAGRDFEPFGTVSVSPEHCFTFRGPECGACGGLCPTPDQAIRFVRNHPVIDTESCVGCGICIDACPTSPVALRFHGRGQREVT